MVRLPQGQAPTSRSTITTRCPSGTPWAPSRSTRTKPRTKLGSCQDRVTMSRKLLMIRKTSITGTPSLVQGKDRVFTMIDSQNLCLVHLLTSKRQQPCRDRHRNSHLDLKGKGRIRLKWHCQFRDLETMIFRN